MDPHLRQTALERQGLLLAAEARLLPAGQRRALVAVQPGVLVAATQPLDLATAVAAVERSAPRVVLAGQTALWAYGVLAAADPPVVDVAVPDTQQLVLLPPARVRRLAPSLLTGARHVDGHRVVSLETAVVQAAERLPTATLLAVVEEVLRQRLTTVARLRAGCRRGVAGSAALRRLLSGMDDGAVDRAPRVLRRALEAVGVDGLESEVLLRSAEGAAAYVDLLHRRSRHAVEVDGWLTHSRPERFLADRRRDRWLRREHGLTTVRVAAVEVEHRLDAVVAELVALLR